MMLESVILQVILVVLCCIVPVENPPLSDSTCPTPLKITPRYLNCSNNKVYHIVRDPRSGGYIERCFISLTVPPGYATVMDKSGNLNTEACHEGTFQRHSYKSNTQCACKETKGHCNETGQVVASNGSTTEDRTCRCDFRRGYKFSIKPSNECFCQSSSEDCTCIKEECGTEYRLSPDYECVPENLYSTTNYTCKDFITSEESTTESVPDNNTSILERMPTGMVPWYVTAIIAICTALVFFAAGVLLEKKCGVYDTIHKFIQQHRPCRNGQASTKNAGTSKGVPVQVTDSDAMLSNIKADETD